MKRILILWVIAIGLAATGCGADESPSLSRDADSLAAGEAEEVGIAQAPSAASTASGIFEPALTERLIIRNASLDLVVKDTEVAVEQINQLADEQGGFLVSSQMIKYDEGVRASLTIRVPAEALDTALAELRALALEVRRQTTSGQDVTEEYTDLEAQLRHLEATETRLLSFLEKAEDTEATLAVFGELQGVQSEIERVKGRIQFLKDASALSTIKIELIPDALAQPISVAGWRPRGTLRNAVETLVRTLQFLVDAFIWVVVFILPVVLLVFGLPGAVLVWLARRWRRRRGSAGQ